VILHDSLVRFTCDGCQRANRQDSAIVGFIDRTGKLVIKPPIRYAALVLRGLVEGYGERTASLRTAWLCDKSDRYVIRLEEQGMMMSSWSAFRKGCKSVDATQHDDGSVGPSPGATLTTPERGYSRAFREQAISTMDSRRRPERMALGGTLTRQANS